MRKLAGAVVAESAADPVSDMNRAERSAGLCDRGDRGLQHAGNKQRLTHTRTLPKPGDRILRVGRLQGNRQ
jgi:hypothetical protein